MEIARTLGSIIEDPLNYYDKHFFSEECIKHACGDSLDNDIGYIASVIFQTVKSGILLNDVAYLTGTQFARHCTLLRIDSSELLKVLMQTPKLIKAVDTYNKKLAHKATKKTNNPNYSKGTLVEQLNNLSDTGYSNMPDKVRRRIALKLEGDTWRTIAIKEGVTFGSCANSVQNYLARHIEY